MNKKSALVILIVLFLFGLANPAKAQLSEEQIYPLFNQGNQAFRQANLKTSNLDEAKGLYEKAILSYERVINDGQIKNAKLYYNLGNAYFLKGDIGKAILNYRRAENLDDSDANIQKNLSFARSRRTDKVKIKTEKQVLKTLFFWHYDFSIKVKFVLTCTFFAVVCLGLSARIWFGSNTTATTISVITVILTLCFLVSVILETYSKSNKICGVITAEKVVARQGDGQNYSESFKEPLHSGMEFELIEQRKGWLHIKLSDNSDGWIPDDSSELI